MNYACISDKNGVSVKTGIWFFFCAKKEESIMTYQKKNKEEKSVELKSCMEQLESGVRQMFESDTYKKWLDAFANFYNYSFNNVLLILSQRPDATICNSFTRWKALDRHVKKGTNGIRILCPVPYKYSVEQEVLKDGQPVYIDNGSKLTEKLERKGIRFRIGYTFDISDTEGKDLPELTKTLTDSPEELERVIKQIVNASDVPITFDVIEYAYGYYSLVDEKIVIRKGLPYLHQLKSCVHELCHSKLHNIKQEKVSHEQREIEAESSAYIVLSYYGFDCSDYSFGYVASYCKNKDIAILKSSIERIESVSREMISFLGENTDLNCIKIRKEEMQS